MGLYKQHDVMKDSSPSVYFTIDTYMMAFLGGEFDYVREEDMHFKFLRMELKEKPEKGQSSV